MGEYVASAFLRAYNGQYVCAEGGGGGDVVANRDQAGDWETFFLIVLGNEFFEDGCQVVLQTVNGHYVSAESGGGREVVANRQDRGPWETFTVERVTGALNGFVTGDQIALRAHYGQYVCAESGGGREVVANRLGRGPWETFTLENLVGKDFNG